MTKISDTATQARENARTTVGQFGIQQHTAPGVALTASTPPEETVYGVYAGDELISTGVKGAGMTDALHRARTHVNGLRPAKGETLPTITIRSEGSDVSVELPLGGGGRIVGWHVGDAMTAEELDDKGISLTQLESVEVEPFIDLGPDNEGDMFGLEHVLRDGDFNISNVYAHRDEETGERHVDVALYENFLWNAESMVEQLDITGCETDDDDDDRPVAEKQLDAWLDKHSSVVAEVYLEWFNADIDCPDTWESANVTIRKTVPYERFTESLVIEDVYPAISEYRNRTDPGTYGSPYVMNEVIRRVDARRSSEEAAVR